MCLVLPLASYSPDNNIFLSEPSISFIKKIYIILRVSSHLQLKRLLAVVQRVDNAIHPRNRYPVDNCQTTYFAIHRIVIYPVDSVIHPSDNWGMPHGLLTTHYMFFFSWADVNKKQIWIWEMNEMKRNNCIGKRPLCFHFWPPPLPLPLPLPPPLPEFLVTCPPRLVVPVLALQFPIPSIHHHRLLLF